MANELVVIPREIDGHVIGQRQGDAYVDVTALCRAAGKQWNDYWRLKSTKEFLAAMSTETGIPVSALVQTSKGGDVAQQGTWAHPEVAIDAAAWCNVRFRIQVNRWVRELVTTGRVEIAPQPPLDVVALVTTAVSETAKAFAAILQASQVRDLVTVEERCEYRWPAAERKTRRRIRDVAIDLLWRRRGKLPLKLGGQKNSLIAFERIDLDILDDAIDRVIDEEGARGRLDLFDGQEGGRP